VTRAEAVLAAALAYALAGLRIFPTAPDKRPYVRWTSEATTDPETVRRWWRRWPEAGIGWAIPPGVVVVDIDPPDGTDQARAAGGLPHGGPIARTPRGGWHVVLALPDEGPWSQRTLRPAVDARVGGKGYIVLPPGDGRTWVRPPTRLADLVTPDRLPVAPAWVAEGLVPPPMPDPPVRTILPRPDLGALARFVARVPVGQRNAALYWAANRAREDGVAFADALALLADAALVGRRPEEPRPHYLAGVRATIRSAYGR
jgi:hypothetical protein